MRNCSKTTLQPSNRQCFKAAVQIAPKQNRILRYYTVQTPTTSTPENINWKSGTLGEDYSQVIERMSILFALDALYLGNVQAPGKLIDIACGPGKLAAYAHDFGLEVLAVDFSKNMIDHVNKTYPQIQTKITDGQTLEGIESNMFDYATSIFGVQAFPDRMAGWKSVLRVLKEGGTFMTAVYDVFGPATLISMHQSIPKYLPQHLKPKIYQDPEKDFKKLNPRFELSDKNILLTELEQAGFRDINIESVIHSIPMKNRDELFDGFLKLSEDMRGIYDSFSEKEKIKWRNDFFEGEGFHDPQKSFVIPQCAHLAVTKK